MIRLLQRSHRTALLILLISLGTTPLVGQSLQDDTSLKFVPADTSFYLLMLRNREQYQRMVNSKAFERIRSMPLVETALAGLKAAWDDQPMAEFFDAPANRELMDVLCASAGDEIFVFGDEQLAVWFNAMNRVGNVMNTSRLKAMQTAEDPQVVAQRDMLQMLIDDPKLLEAPTTVFGCRVDDVAQAKKQVAHVESLIKQLLEAQAPDMMDRLTRKQIGDAEFLTFRLDGSLVPWEEMLSDAELEPKQAETLLARLKNTKISVSMGVWQSYLLWSFSKDDAVLANLGRGELLASKAELQPLKKAAGKPVTSVSFVSGDFLRQISAVDQQIDQMVTMLQAATSFLPVPDDQRESLSRDAGQFGKELKAQVPQLGSVTSYAYETDLGFESFSYNWSEQKTLDGSQPLDILNNLGGSPIAFFAARRKAQPQAYEFANKWMGKLFGYVQDIGKPFMSEEQVELFDKASNEMAPLMKQIGDANRKKLRPAFADGQTAIVLDSKLTSPNWTLAMPPSDVELPFPEISCVYRIRDAKTLKEGYAECFSVLQTALTKMNELAPDTVPPIELPPPTGQTSDTGTVYSYPLPPITGIDERIAPNAGLSEQTLVMSLVPDATRRLMQPVPYAGQDSLVNADRNLAYAWQFDTAAFVQMIRPWVAYGFEVAADEGAVDEDIEGQVNTVLDVLSCFQNSSGIAYMEDGVLVSHSRSVIRDLP